MKKFFKWAFAIALPLIIAGGIYASRVVYNQTLVSETALAYDNTYVLDLGASNLAGSNIDELSMQAAYSSATISALPFTDGLASTATITVSSYSALVGLQGKNTLTINTNSALAGKSFNLNGTVLREGGEWTKAGVSSNTAINIVNAVNAYGGLNAVFQATCTVGASVVTITCVNKGTACNQYTLTSSTPAAMAAGSAKFTGGLNDGFLAIAGVTLINGTNFTAATSNAVTAKAISDAIQANSTLAAIISSTWSAAGVISATSTLTGANRNYGIWTSSYAALTPNATQMQGGSDSAIVTASSKIKGTAHGFTTALPVLFAKSAGTAPGALVANTTYYVIKVDANSFKLASSAANAKLGTSVSIATQTAQGGGSFTLTPLAIAGTPSFKWQASNDLSNWVDLSVSSVTMSSLAPASTSWDFGTINYRYIRLNVVAPTAGGINLVVTGLGKSSN